MLRSVGKGEGERAVGRSMRRPCVSAGVHACSRRRKLLLHSVNRYINCMYALDALLDLLNEKWIDEIDDFTETEKDYVMFACSLRIIQAQLEMSIITNHSD